jgi:hypothetical protein
MGAGFGMTALASMLDTSVQAAPGASANPWSVKQPHFPPKAKHVILVFLTGGLSSIDSFDYKPLLDKYDGQPLPYATPRTEFATGNLMRSPFTWTRYGQNGTEVSEIFPQMGGIIDEFCQIRSPSPHPEPRTFRADDEHGKQPGAGLSMGSWISCLGNGEPDLPGSRARTIGGRRRRSQPVGFGVSPAISGHAGSHRGIDPGKQIRSLTNSKLNGSSSAASSICAS